MEKYDICCKQTPNIHLVEVKDLPHQENWNLQKCNETRVIDRTAKTSVLNGRGRVQQQLVSREAAEHRDANHRQSKAHMVAK